MPWAGCTRTDSAAIDLRTPWPAGSADHAAATISGRRRPSVGDESSIRATLPCLLEIGMQH